MASRSTRSKRVPTQPEEPQSRAKWTASLTKTLADLMVDQVREGNRPKKSFATKAWNSICDNFRKETGLMWDKEQLKSRFAALKKQYNIVKSLLEHRDFSYDESSCTIIATDEAWYNYVQDHPDADIIRIGGCPIYKQLCIIFLELGANGKGSHVEEIPETPYPEPMNVLPVESASGSEEVANMEYKEEDHVPHATNKNGRKRGRKGIDDSIAEAILKMAAASKLRTAAVEQYRARFSMTNCIKALDEVQGIDEPVYFAALDLFNNPSAREIFLSLKHDKRLTWLQGKCAGPSVSLENPLTTEGGTVTVTPTTGGASEATVVASHSSSVTDLDEEATNGSQKSQLEAIGGGGGGGGGRGGRAEDAAEEVQLSEVGLIGGGGG
ncbi:Myb/SANT-like domain, partial [Dillenia turbinata]